MFQKLAKVCVFVSITLFISLFVSLLLRNPYLIVDGSWIADKLAQIPTHIFSETDNNFILEHIQMNEYDFTMQLGFQDYFRSLPINIKVLFDQSNSNYNRNIWSKLLLTNSPTTHFRQFIEQFNNQTRTISQNVEKECIRLMTTSYKYGIFSQDSTFSLYNDKLFVFSKIYCLNSFNLQIAFDEETNNITMVGDKISYSWFNKLLNVLLLHIETQILNVNPLKNIDNYPLQTNKIITPNLVLTSCKQKLRVLKEMIYILSDLIGYSFYTILNKNLISINSYTLQNIEKLLNEQLVELHSLDDKLTKTFPGFDEQLLEQTTILLEERRIKEKQNKLKMFTQTTETLQNDFDTNYSQYNLIHSFHTFRVATTGYVNILSQSIDLGAFSLKNITKNCIGFIISVPLGFLEGFSYNLSELVFTLINNLWLSVLVLLVMFRIVTKICNIFGL